MKSWILKSVRKWSLYGGLLAIMAYSTLTLYSEPAYAAICTSTECQPPGPDYQQCYQLCHAQHAGIAVFACPDPNHNYEFICNCTNGNHYELLCSGS
jgi:hypothetical protein